MLERMKKMKKIEKNKKHTSSLKRKKTKKEHTFIDKNIYENMLRIRPEPSDMLF